MGPQDTIQYWLFQSNPKIFRMREALKAGHLRSFAITAHKSRIKQGDKVILWESGKHAGCYGLATVQSPVEVDAPGQEEASYFFDPPVGGHRVKLKIDYNLWNKGITREVIPTSRSFDRFYAGLPGTNYKATSQQYKELESLVLQLDAVNEPVPEYQLPTPRFDSLNIILYGPPGTGKTYLSINYALSIIENRSLEELALEDRQELRRRFNGYVEQGQAAFVTFHQAFSYEDFLEGIKPVVKDGQVEYQIENGLFKSLSIKARQSLDNILDQQELDEEITDSELPLLPERVLAESQKYVLIIDEINRGNMPAIFGDLISLIEENKRAGRAEALTSILPYSKTPFSVPPNLYLIGTMNTADRSIEMLDHALRRRFRFVELLPNPSLITTRLGSPMTAGIDLVRLLKVINYRIELLLNSDYCLGHAYFFNVNNLQDLINVFEGRVIPLLQEYFFNDPGKIGLVLGKDFVRAKMPPGVDEGFADFDHPMAGEFRQKINFELVPVQTLDEVAFIHIYDADYTS